MFKLLKDIETYAGVPPYASEHYGVYYPLLGWASRFTKKWIQRGGFPVDPNVKRILDGRLLPGPQFVRNGDPREFLAQPLEPATGRSPFKVVLAKELNSELLKLVQQRVQEFVDSPAHRGRLPEDGEWNQIIEIN